MHMNAQFVRTIRHMPDRGCFHQITAVRGSLRNDRESNARFHAAMYSRLQAHLRTQ
jgi:hypothetical protein